MRSVGSAAIEELAENLLVALHELGVDAGDIDVAKVELGSVAGGDPLHRGEEAAASFRDDRPRQVDCVSPTGTSAGSSTACLIDDGVEHADVVAGAQQRAELFEGLDADAGRNLVVAQAPTPDRAGLYGESCSATGGSAVVSESFGPPNGVVKMVEELVRLSGL